MKTLALALLGALLGALATPAGAQDWPTHTVRMIVPFGAGSTPDSLARIVADRLQARLGQPFVVENKAGASGNLGTDAVAKAAPDGYTLGLSIVGPLALNTLIFPSLPYDPARDLAPVTILAAQPSILVVSKDLPVNSAEELVALLKRDPGKYSYGSIGSGSLSHLAMEALAQRSGSHPVHVPYGGSPQAVTALIRGDVQMAVLPAASVAAQGEAGQIKMLAVSSARRSSLFPRLPTLKEAGIPDVEADAWVGLVAPATTSEAIIGELQKEVLQILAEPDTRKKLRDQFMEPVGNSPAEFRAVVTSELDRWAPVIKAANIKVGR